MNLSFLQEEETYFIFRFKRNTSGMSFPNDSNLSALADEWDIDDEDTPAPILWPISELTPNSQIVCCGILGTRSEKGNVDVDGVPHAIFHFRQIKS